MWTIDNQTPFATGQSFTQDDHPGDIVWMVGVKATFKIDFESHKIEIAEEQEDLKDADEFRDEATNSSILNPCDFALSKKKIDVLLQATAYAPEEKPVTELMTGLIVGPLRKTLTVYGNRVYDRFMGKLFQSPPSKFIQMPLIYEKAYGGFDRDSEDDYPPYELRNPIGTGFYKKRSSATDLSLPNIEYADFPTAGSSKKNKVAGYGPIAPHWSPRIDYAGTIDENGERDITNIRPPDFDPIYYQQAPEDQHIEEIHGGEPVVLYNMHPEFSEIKTHLPQIEIEFKTLIENEVITKPGRLQSIHITPDEGKLRMVWQANFSNGVDPSAIKTTSVTHNIINL